MNPPPPDKPARRIWYPFTQAALDPRRLRVVRGEGACLIREEGSRIVDAVSSRWVNLHGHTHPRIAEAAETLL